MGRIVTNRKIRALLKKILVLAFPNATKIKIADIDDGIRITFEAENHTQEEVQAWFDDLIHRIEINLKIRSYGKDICDGGHPR